MKYLYTVCSTLFFFCMQAQVFGPMETITSSSTVHQYCTVLDVNSDGLLDVVVSKASAVPQQVVFHWFANLGAGQFGPEQYMFDISAYPVGRIVADDMDADGDQDLIFNVFANAVIGDVLYVENLGGGTFALPVMVTAAADNCFRVATGDLDGDGDQDVVSLSLGAGIAWYANSGNGTFGSQTIIQSNIASGQDMEIIDMDGDGDMDIVYSTAGADDEVRLLSNDGAAVFTPAVVVATGDNPQQLAVGDIDSDGDPDVLISTSNDGIFWSSNSAGTFNPSAPFTWTVPFQQEADLADVDGNGTVDALGSGSSDHLAWFLNTGGTFGSAQTLTQTLALVKNAQFVDLDGDSDPDILACGLTEVVWFENLTLSTGMEDQMETDLLIAPNPMDEQALLQHAAGQFDHMHVLDARGRLIYTQNIEQGITETIIHRETLGTGCYLVQLIGANRVSSIKLMVR